MRDFEPGDWNDPSIYRNFITDKKTSLQARLENPKRFQRISEREERSDLNAESMKGIIAGKYNQVYRGIDFLKAPEDFGIYNQMFWYIKPRTVIEIGVFRGASVLWIADTLKALKIDCDVFGIDIDLSLLSPQAKAERPPNVTFLESESKHIDRLLPSSVLDTLSHPIIIIDDAHDDFDIALNHLDKHLIPGDYIVCEDTSPDIAESGHTGLDAQEGYVPAGMLKLNRWREFLEQQGDKYAVDAFFSDFYGYNASSNWNGYVRKMK